MTRSTTARVRASRLQAPLLCLSILSLALGCASFDKWWNPTKGYEAVGTPKLEFEEAKAMCEEESEFRGAQGTTNTDWTAFERCMKNQGWVRP